MVRKTGWLLIFEPNSLLDEASGRDETATCELGHICVVDVENVFEKWRFSRAASKTKDAVDVYNGYRS